MPKLIQKYQWGGNSSWIPSLSLGTFDKPDKYSFSYNTSSLPYNKEEMISAFISSDENWNNWQKKNTESIVKSIETQKQVSPEDSNNIFYGKNSQAISQGVDAIGNVANSFAKKDMYGGPKGNITQAIDQGWGQAADVASQFGPWGKMVGGIMKGVQAVNKISNAALGDKALDNMTTQDAILSSPLGFGLGWINALTGANANTIAKNEEAFAKVGSSYGGANNAVDEALLKSGKRYGGLSSGARKDANAEIAAARAQQNTVEDISDEAEIRSNLQASMAAILGNRRSLALQGGYNQSAVRVGKKGMSFTKEFKYEEAPDFEYKEAPIIYKDGGKTRTLEELIEYAKQQNPRFVQRMSEPMKYIRINSKDENGNINWNHSTHQLNRKENYVFPMIQEIDGNLKLFDNENEAFNSAKASNNFLIFNSPEEAELFHKNYKSGWKEFFDTPVWDGEGTQVGEINEFEDEPYYKSKLFKDGGFITDDFIYKEAPIFIYQECPEQIDSFQKGGSINIIPEGALHARKHNIDLEGITKKGIPVISENESGEITQQAEIEHSEIIFRLEVTEQIESLAKENTDEAAIEAGRLLVKEILYNTDDRTNLINQV